MNGYRNLKFCANLSFMYQEHTSLIKRYEAAAASGFRGVEIGHDIFSETTSLEEIASKKESLKLEQILLNAFPGGSETFLSKHISC
jgi:hydroxypyruvate isomerase